MIEIRDLSVLILLIELHFLGALLASVVDLVQVARQVKRLIVLVPVSLGS